MERKHEILAELQEAAPFLAQWQPVMPYQVPAGYFDSVSGAVMAKLEDDVSLPVMEASFSVPNGYFEGLAGNIMAKIRQHEDALTEVQAELAEMAPLLNTINKTQPYTVPQGYFENISFTPADKQPAKVIGFKRAGRWTQYAAAAVMAGVLITGAFLFTDKNGANYNDATHMDVSAELNKVSDHELVTYLNNPEQISTDIDVKKNIENMSDEELDQYLSENPEMDLAVPASN